MFYKVVPSVFSFWKPIGFAEKQLILQCIGADSIENCPYGVFFG